MSQSVPSSWSGPELGLTLTEFDAYSKSHGKWETSELHTP